MSLVMIKVLKYRGENIYRDMHSNKPNNILIVCVTLREYGRPDICIGANVLVHQGRSLYLLFDVSQKVMLSIYQVTFVFKKKCHLAV